MQKAVVFSGEEAIDKSAVVKKKSVIKQVMAPVLDEAAVEEVTEEPDMPYDHVEK